MNAPKTEWIAPGEKYAVMALEVKLEKPQAFEKFTSRLSAFGETQPVIPDHWREWLGSIRSERIDSCNLFLLSKVRSHAPDVLDAESNMLLKAIGEFYMGLMLASPFVPAHPAIELTGGCSDGEITVRHQGEFLPLVPNLISNYPEISHAELARAAHLADSFAKYNASYFPGGRWRLNRITSVYMDARTKPHILDQLHQYARCIDGLILSEPGKGASRFKSRTELFIGPKHHNLMGGAYEMRSNIEHLHEHRYLEEFSREVRLKLLETNVILEYISRNALARIFEKEKLWGHFANATALEKFWSLDADKRKMLWGDPIDPQEALKDYRPEFISDGHLKGE